ncbi:hypothetical protein HYN59_08655 [Flavobacterium album]|uniref:Transporter n=1 Tax=Flavobacterium album TaxID=2175091 RepID=A0A2S1QXN9_9FLAO|nr:transporter [Flavobacterium album]AWH85187.1 hypothetical protein HYN59_08655 [Flavobacterium album]
MKKTLFILLFALLSATKMLAGDGNPPDFKKYLEAFDDCDACGCSASGGGMGFSSMINQNFVGLRYIYQSYSTKDGIFNNSPWVGQDFNTIQAWARIPVFKRLQLSVQVPYHFNSRELATGTQNISGIGDITVLGLYNVYMTKKDSTVFTHILSAGGGVKAPVGKYDSNNNGSVNPSFQLGTGSWDYVLAAEYVIRKKQWGLNAMTSYIMKTENSKQYQFGNQFNYNATLFYAAEGDKITWVPQAGIAGEIYATNRQYSQDVPGTKGDILFSKLGLEAGTGKFSAGVNAMLPISQNLIGGRVEANYRLSVNLNYSL